MMAREYKDSIRIHTEDSLMNLVVPINAYPVMNRENPRAIFPTQIDFGICDIGSRKMKVGGLV